MDQNKGPYIFFCGLFAVYLMSTVISYFSQKSRYQYQDAFLPEGQNQYQGTFCYSTVSKYFRIRLDYNTSFLAKDSYHPIESFFIQLLAAHGALFERVCMGFQLMVKKATNLSQGPLGELIYTCLNLKLP